MATDVIHIQLEITGVPLCNAHRSQRLLTMPIPNWKTLRQQQTFQRKRPWCPRLCYNCVKVFARTSPLDAS